MYRKIGYPEMLKLKRWNTPTISNGWEQIKERPEMDGVFNVRETHDFMPQMGPMIGRAITVVCQPSKEEHKINNPDAYENYRRYVASVDGPKIVIVKDLDKPNYIGSFWGEVMSNMHRSLGCVGTITEGAIRDLDEMTNAGFKALAERLCVSHCYSTPIEYGIETEVFGCKIKPGQLIHADKHGFFVVPEEDEDRLLEGVLFMDNNECDYVIPAGRNIDCKSKEEILRDLSKANSEFARAAKERFGRTGEWK